MRTAFDSKLNKQVAILPGATGLEITQGPNPAKDGHTVANTSLIYWSHRGYHAIDHADNQNNDFYAPFDMKCVKHVWFEPTHFTFFSSLEEVICADGTTGFVSMVCIHGGNPTIDGENSSGNKVTALSVGVIIRQGHKCYEMGMEGLSSGPHIHFEVMKGKLEENFNYLSYMKSYTQTNSDGDTFPADGFINGEFAENVFYKLSSDHVAFPGHGSNWSGHINFKTYSTLPFNPVGKPNGWNEYNGEWYYVRNGQCVTGWLQDGTSWYYLEADGKMKKGWLASGNDWFYLSPGSGVMQVNTFVDDDKFYVGADGKMVRTGWTLIGSNYYYFKDKNRDTDSRYAGFADGQKVTSTWIPGSSWFYVLSNGIMAKNCQIRENGKYFAFNNSGACLNSSGQSTAYNTTTYPIKS